MSNRKEGAFEIEKMTERNPVTHLHALRLSQGHIEPVLLSFDAPLPPAAKVLHAALDEVVVRRLPIPQRIDGHVRVLRRGGDRRVDVVRKPRVVGGNLVVLHGEANVGPVLDGDFVLLMDEDAPQHRLDLLLFFLGDVAKVPARERRAQDAARGKKATGKNAVLHGRLAVRTKDQQHLCSRSRAIPDSGGGLVVWPPRVGGVRSKKSAQGQTKKKRLATSHCHRTL
jgi:hypothetical protein